MDRHGLLNWGLLGALALPIGCGGDGDEPPATGMTTMAAGTDGGGMDEGSDESAGDDDDEPQGDDDDDDDAPEACIADCTYRTECGFVDDEAACLEECTAVLDDLEPDCASAWATFIECEAGSQCDEALPCDAESAAVDSVCEPASDIGETCTAYCVRAEECAPDEEYPLAECESDCGVDTELLPASCQSAELALLDCHATTECVDWDALGGDDSPCAAQEEAWSEVCF